MDVPLIDFDAYGSDELPAALDDALTHYGFVILKNIGIDHSLREETFAMIETFFDQSLDKKAQHAYEGTVNNFGYQAPLTETLDPSKPADIKETFTMRNLDGRATDVEAWPDEAYRTVSMAFYQNCLKSAFRVLRVFADALQVDSEFFVSKHTGENITMRYLHYPAIGYQPKSDSQMGAGAHTDYGSITLLFQDDIGGLQLKAQDGAWIDVAPIKDAVIINTGDLMERWSNGRYPSTEHRVLPRIGVGDRYSIAFFTDPDSDALIQPLPACVTPGHSALYYPVTAGEHILARLDAAQTIESLKS